MQHFMQSHPLFSVTPQGESEFLDFAQKISELAMKMQLNLANYEIDHLAIRVNSENSAKSWLTALLKYGTILSDNIVNGRVIYLIQLNEPLLFLGQLVEIIELPFPKNKYYPVESWEHIEIVMPFLAEETSAQWAARIRASFLWDQFACLNVKLDEPKVEGEQLANPSIAVSLKDNRVNHTCIKVHPYNIKKVIKV